MKHFAFVFVLALLALACTNDAPPMGNTVVGRDSLPVMVTNGVSKLITDSGMMRYKIIAEQWRVYDKTKPPRWEFPKGIFIERFDDNFKVDLYITADSAWLYDQNLWHLRGNIVLNDKSGSSRMTTEDLYWDMQTGLLSSDVYSRLTQPDQEIEGDWFRATLRNGNPTQYHIRQSKGFMPMGDMGTKSSSSTLSPTDTLRQSDSIAVPLHEAPVKRRKTR